MKKFRKTDIQTIEEIIKSFEIFEGVEYIGGDYRIEETEEEYQTRTITTLNDCLAYAIDRIKDLEEDLKAREKEVRIYKTTIKMLKNKEL